MAPLQCEAGEVFALSGEARDPELNVIGAVTFSQGEHLPVVPPDFLWSRLLYGIEHENAYAKIDLRHVAGLFYPTGFYFAL